MSQMKNQSLSLIEAAFIFQGVKAPKFPPAYTFLL